MTTEHIVAAQIRPSGGASFASAVDYSHLPVPQTSGASAGEKTLSARGEMPTSYTLTIYSYEDTSIVPTPKDWEVSRASLECFCTSFTTSRFTIKNH